VTSFIHQHFAQFSPLQAVLWSMYLVAALTLPLYHITPALKYLRGNSGIGDACIRTEIVQCGWRIPALLFSVFVVPSLPLFLSIFLDMLGRIARISAMCDSKRRWQALTASPTSGAGAARGFGAAPACALPPQRFRRRSPATEDAAAACRFRSLEDDPPSAGDLIRSG
jgi:hypothetical protein